MEENDEAIKLYIRFRLDLRHRPISDRFYEEDELLDIFDYASDVVDDYARAEVLLLGARLYPDSTALYERRAIFYRHLNEDVCKSLLADNAKTETPLTKILQLASFTGSRDKAIEIADSILKQEDFSEDETVIQYIQTLASLDLMDWMIQHLDELRAKVEYLPTLLYEVAIAIHTADYDDGRDVQIKLLEELTEIDPYCKDFWTMLASALSKRDRIDEATQAIEYALAISPDNVEALKVKYDLTPVGTPEWLHLVSKLATMEQSDISLTRIALSALELLNDTDAINSVLTNALKEHPDNCLLIEKAIERDIPNLAEILENYYNAGCHLEADWRYISDRAYLMQKFDAIKTISEVYSKLSGHDLNIGILSVIILYKARKYEQVIEMIETADETSDIAEPEYFYFTIAIQIMSMLRLGDIDKASQFIQSISQSQEYLVSTTSTIFPSYGFKKFIETVHLAISIHQEADFWQSFDPLNLDKM